MKKTVLALGLMFITSSSFAYQAQIDAGFTYYDQDENQIDQHGAFETKGTYYLESVQQNNSPFNESAFLGHNSNIYAKYSYEYIDTEQSIDLPNSAKASIEGQSNTHRFDAGIEYFLNQIYLNGEIGLGQLKNKISVRSNTINTAEKSDYDVTAYRVMAGFMPLDNLLLAAGVNGYKGDGEDKDNALALRAKYVTAIGQDGHFINLEALGSYGDIDSTTVAADFYFDPTFSLGAAYNRNDYEHSSTDFISVRSKYFFNPNLAIGGAVGFGNDVQNIHVNATFRF